MMNVVNGSMMLILGREDVKEVEIVGVWGVGDFLLYCWL